MKSKETVKKINNLIQETLGTEWCVSDLDIYRSGIAMLTIGLRERKYNSNEDGSHPAKRDFDISFSYDSDTIEGGSSMEMSVKEKKAFELLDDNICKDYFVGVAMLLTNFRLKWQIVDILNDAIKVVREAA